MADHIGDPVALAQELDLALRRFADDAYLQGQQRAAPGIGPMHGVRVPYQRALRGGFLGATKHDSAATLLFIADRLLRERLLEARWLALAILARTVLSDPERSWQLLRRAARDAGDWITVDTLAYPFGRGILGETYRWAELEQLVISPSRWERRLVGSTIAGLPFLDHRAGRTHDVTERALPILGTLMGDAEPDVQKALAWAYRSMTIVDPAATAAALAAETDIATTTGDGLRAWVIRDSLPKLDPATAARLRARLEGIRRRPGAAATSTAARLAKDFEGMGLGRSMPEPPLT